MSLRGVSWSAADTAPRADRLPRPDGQPDRRRRGDSAYPYRDIEYAYTDGTAPGDSLTAGFLAYLDKESSRQVIRTRGHLPCGTPVGLKLCG